ncbi:MAG: metallophosphoesterase [Akkermansiaceae bacterium]
MKRRGFIGTMAGGLSVATGQVAEQQGQVKSLVTTPLAVMAPRPDGVELLWGVSRLCIGHVEWKSGDRSGVARADRFGLSPQGNETLRVRIDGLAPGMEYAIRSITESADRKLREESAWKVFRTLDPKAEKSTFVVWNDTHERHDTIRALHEKTPKADFMVWNGDTCNDWHQEAWLVPTLLSPAGADITDGRPLMMVWGNHDVRGRWAYRMEDFVATPSGRPYYAFRSGPVAVVCLHTGEDKPDDHPSFGGRVAFEVLRQEQAEWLRKVTQSPEMRGAPYRVVFCHIPLRWKVERNISKEGYNNTTYDHFSRFSRDAWHDALVAWKAQVVVSGHTHEPYWMEANETFPYAQLVGGGPRLEQATWIEGEADGTFLTFRIKTLTEKVIQECRISPLV